MKKTIYILFVVIFVNIPKIYGQELFKSILDSLSFSDKTFSNKTNYSDTCLFTGLDRKENFNYTRNSFRILNSYKGYSIYAANISVNLPTNNFFLYDHVAKRCFFFLYHNGIRFSESNKKGKITGHFFKSEISEIVEIDCNSAPINGLSINSFIEPEDWKKGDISGKDSYYPIDNEWYVRSEYYPVSNNNIYNISYNTFLGLISDAVDNNANTNKLKDSKNKRVYFYINSFVNN